MCRGRMLLILALLAPAVFSTPLQPKGVPQLLRSQFLSQDEIERSIVRLENGDRSEYGELMTTEERSFDGETTLRLMSENREIELKIKPNYRLIKPFARLRIMDGDDERESDFHPSLRTSFYHGSVSGSPNGLASMVRNENGWNGMIMTEDQRYIVHGVQGSSRALLLPMSTEDEELYNGYRFLEAEHRAQEYNMTGDESFSRSTDSEFELEIGVYTDEDLYKFVKEKYPDVDDTNNKVQEVALITLNTVHTFYQKPSMGNKIAVVVAAMTVMTSNPSGLQKNNKMETYLDNYCDWDADYNNPGGANYDFGLLFSGIDMYGDKPSDTGTAGMAPVSRTCLHNTKRSCAIGEAISFGSGIIMAHEIGHNLGMHHDSSGNTCQGNGFIMGAMISAGATTFSTCSRDYLKEYLKSLDDFGVNCMRDEGKSSMEHSVEGKLPGERVQKGDQCRFALGDGWKEYPERHDFCAQMWCSKGNSLRSPNGGPPLPGTPCVNGGVCWDGTCSNRDDVIKHIKDYTPTNSGNSGKHLPLDQLCQKQAPQYPTAVTYELTQNSYVRYPDISNMCSQGMICQSNNPISLMMIEYPAPPGTSCAAGKTCQHFQCK